MFITCKYQYNLKSETPMINVLNCIGNRWRKHITIPCNFTSYLKTFDCSIFLGSGALITPYEFQRYQFSCHTLWKQLFLVRITKMWLICILDFQYLLHITLLSPEVMISDYSRLLLASNQYITIRFQVQFYKINLY